MGVDLGLEGLHLQQTLFLRVTFVCRYQLLDAFHHMVELAHQCVELTVFLRGEALAQIAVIDGTHLLHDFLEGVQQTASRQGGEQHGCKDRGQKDGADRQQQRDRIIQKHGEGNPLGQMPACAGELAGDHRIPEEMEALRRTRGFRNAQEKGAVFAPEVDGCTVVGMLRIEETEIFCGDIDGQHGERASALIIHQGQQEGHHCGGAAGPIAGQEQVHLLILAAPGEARVGSQALPDIRRLDGKGLVFCFSLYLHGFADAEDGAVPLEQGNGADIAIGADDEGELIHDGLLEQNILRVHRAVRGQVYLHVLVLHELAADVVQAVRECVHLVGHVGQAILALLNRLIPGNSQKHEEACCQSDCQHGKMDPQDGGGKGALKALWGGDSGMSGRHHSFLQSFGDTSVIFLNTLEKYPSSEKPVLLAMSQIL